MTIKQLFSTAPVTTLLLVSFIGLFIIQLLTGVDANEPSLDALLYWGANTFTLTMVNEPWRLVSSGFLHIGLMHLLFNGFAMYFLGKIAEPMFGSTKFLALFLLAVVGGNLLNGQMKWLWILDVGIDINHPRIIEILGLSAGASGGIMGIGGALLIAAFFKMSVNGMMLNLKSLMLVLGINLVYGFAVPGIDNAAHIGGAITGLIIALPIAFAYRQRLMAQQAALANAQAAYQSTVRADYQSNLINSSQAIDSNNLPLTNIFADNNSQIPVNLEHNAPAYVTTKTIAAEPIKVSIIWQLLPWITMLIIVIGFVWWWQDIHNQILQILAATQPSS